MLLDSGMDSGPILLSKEVSVGPLETAGQLHDRLAVIGAELLLETISGLKTGRVSPKPQPDDGASLAPMLKKEDGLLDWSRPAEELARQVRGLDPWPGAYTSFQGKNLKVFGAQALPGQGQPGRIMALADGLIHVAAGRDSLALAELQLAGKNRQDAAQFWNGQHLQPGMVFGD
jgi:methionyl-tRNA formyltransferase